MSTNNKTNSSVKRIFVPKEDGFKSRLGRLWTTERRVPGLSPAHVLATRGVAVVHSDTN